MVRFTRDHLSKAALKRILNGPQTGAERTLHSPFRFMYVTHVHAHKLIKKKIFFICIRIQMAPHPSLFLFAFEFKWRLTPAQSQGPWRILYILQIQMIK